MQPALDYARAAAAIANDSRTSTQAHCVYSCNVLELLKAFLKDQKKAGRKEAAAGDTSSDRPDFRRPATDPVTGLVAVNDRTRVLVLRPDLSAIVADIEMDDPRGSVILHSSELGRQFPGAVGAPESLAFSVILGVAENGKRRYRQVRLDFRSGVTAESAKPSDVTVIDEFHDADYKFPQCVTSLAVGDQGTRDIVVSDGANNVLVCYSGERPERVRSIPVEDGWPWLISADQTRRSIVVEGDTKKAEYAYPSGQVLRREMSERFCTCDGYGFLLVPRPKAIAVLDLNSPNDIPPEVFSFPVQYETTTAFVDAVRGLLFLASSYEIVAYDLGPQLVKSAHKR